MASPIAHQIHEGAHRPLRRLEIRHLRRHQRGAGLARHWLAPSSRRMRFSCSAGCFSAPISPLRCVGGGADRGRTIDRQQGIDVAVLHQRADGVGVTLGIGVADDVDWIGAAPGRRQHGVEFAHRFRAQARPSLPPAAISRSVASTPAPPPLLTMARRSPRCGDIRAKVAAASNNSSTSLTRNMPARRNAAS